MKKLFIITILLIGCSYKPALSEVPYYYNGCVEVCNNEGSNCRNICGLHHYKPGGLEYYYDERTHIWIGPHGYWNNNQWYPNGHMPE